ncbi:MAG TPA: hypothetical protein PL192_06285 [Polynucleobacter sp.]|nr:hypothetical protein [Polynucleobacter sp.]HQS60248.1 hypothetical protein [Polynucleobacter sp.]HQT20809.1 hypothetical protein [Polynucleobacter sp.]HQT41651.1 hypothetical protein [Polynucleobacter sp.]
MSVNVSKFTRILAIVGRSQASLGSAFFLYGLSIGIFIGTTGCAAPLMALGSSTTAVASSAGTAAASVAVANPSTAVSAVSTVTTGKSPLEHAASAATKQDCNFLNALGSKPICIDIPIPQIKDMSEPYPGPADLPTLDKQK